MGLSPRLLTSRKYVSLVLNPRYKTVLPTSDFFNIHQGIDSKIFDHLFTTKAVGKGTGLGLAIARQIIVEKHDGAINVNSQLGEGTEFMIELPLSG